MAPDTKTWLDVVKMYVRTEHELPSYSGSKVIAQTDRYTDRQADKQKNRQTHRQTDLNESSAYRHTRMVIKPKCER